MFQLVEYQYQYTVYEFLDVYKCFGFLINRKCGAQYSRTTVESN